MMIRLSSLSPLCLVLVACGTRTPAADAAPETGAQVVHDTLAVLGSHANPVKTRGPFGEREYLMRLRCADGAAPAFRRDGSVGEGGDGHILDSYSVDCPNGGRSASVYMELLNRPDGPVEAGFSGIASVGFVVDTTRRVEPGSLEMAEFVQPREREAAERFVLSLRFSPAEHHAGCLVRQGTGIQVEFR